MFMKNFQLAFLMFLFMGTFIAVSSNSWFTCWLGLEINLMSLIPLILFNIENSSTEAAIKYFITQAFASIILIFFSTLLFYLSSNFSVNLISPLILFALAIKAGMAPFHFWFPQVMKLLNWTNSFLLLIWQKIAPFILMSYFSQNTLVIILMLSSAVVGGIGGLNQILIKIILTYSSIIHSGWMLMLSCSEIKLWSNYFFIYSFITSAILISSWNMNVDSMSNLFLSSEMLINKMLFSFNIMSLGGLPPFLGFYAKMMAIINGAKTFSILVLLSLITMSLCSLFYYMKLVYNLSMNNNSTSNIWSNPKKSNSANKFLISSVLGNTLISGLVFLT